MKHASDTALESLEPLLVEIRKFNDLKETKRGVFYRKGAAFLHFHEDPVGLFADMRVGKEWKRSRVSTRAEQRRLLREIRHSPDHRTP
jgi:hypothetical protein